MVSKWFRSRVTGVLGLGAALVGCAGHQRAVPDPWAPQPETSHEVDPEAEEASKLVAEGKALREKALELATEDGPHTLRLARAVESCRGDHAYCLDRAKKLLGKHAPLAYLTGVALYVTRPFDGDLSTKAALAVKNNVEAARLAVNGAEKLLEKRAQQAQDVVTNARMEEAALAEAHEQCEDRASCSSKCDEGEGAYCSVMGDAFKAEGKPRLALDSYKKACEAGFKRACGDLISLSRELDRAEAEVDNAWGEVESSVDELVLKEYQLKFAAKYAHNRRQARAIVMMRDHVKAYRAEVYCPAAKAFMATHGQSEFRERSKTHCEERAPVTTSISGAEVELSAECRATYAIPCK